MQGVIFEHFLTYPSIEIEEGKVAFLTGPSGCGKTTLLRICNRTVTPSAGTVFYRGQRIEEIPPLLLRKEVLLFPQQVFLFEGTIRDNLQQFYAYRSETLPKEEELGTFLDVCCVPFGLDHPCDDMSGGERQRVAMAIFLSFMPKVFLLDEPTSALDAQTAEQLLNNLTSFCKERGTDMMIISHSHALVEKFAEQVISLPGREDTNGRAKS